MILTLPEMTTDDSVTGCENVSKRAAEPPGGFFSIVILYFDSMLLPTSLESIWVILGVPHPPPLMGGIDT